MSQHENIHHFAFIPGYRDQRFEDQDPINVRAARIMGDLHDALEASGCRGRALERLLVRILFCLFAEDTGIFQRKAFRLYLENRTRPDGSDLGLHLARLFEVLNTPADERQAALDETLAAFPYVNGELFAERVAVADCDRDVRNRLLACARFDWSRISPAIFGWLFQAVMEPRQRRQVGRHYTNQRDILKVIRALFLDELQSEFERARAHPAQLRRFHEKLARLRFLDPACGCGDFLVITYRELRLLEIEVLKTLHPGTQLHLDVDGLSRLDVDAFFGIEISQWPARIAEVAMWLMDHQMNLRLSETFGQHSVRPPLKRSPTIRIGNALRLDWQQLLPSVECNYVLGNPPFVGKQFATAQQKADMALVADHIRGSGVLDYAAGWYLKAAGYIAGTRCVVGFVSTNSISQGEQVGILWHELFQRYRVKIHFAHRTFVWESEACGKASVHVVIVGFGQEDRPVKRLFDYEGNGHEATVSPVRNISPYLIEGEDVVILGRSQPLCDVPEIVFGNMPNDGRHLILTLEERRELLLREPAAKALLRPLVGAQEFLNGQRRWCLWLVDATPDQLRTMPAVMERIEAVRRHRIKSRRAATRALAARPHLFGEIRQPDSSYLLIPSVSSETRRYIPIGFMPKTVIGSNLVLFVPGATHYHFGVLSSAMHMAWVRQVCGRLKSDYRYSNKLVYNNFPWPPSPDEKRRLAVEQAARAVLDARKHHPRSTLADLYDPLVMPAPLVKAHRALDRAVDRCYRSSAFSTQRQRVEWLFELYRRLVSSV